MYRHIQRAALAVLVVSMLSLPLQAGTSTWTNSTLDGKWSTNANWDTPPQPGDNLVFSSATAGNAVNNFAPDTAFHDITVVGNHNIVGNRIAVTGTITLDDANPNDSPASWQADVILNSAIRIVSDSEPMVHWSGSIFLNQHDLTVTTNNALAVEGVIGGSGTIYKDGADTLYLAGNNTFSGQISVVAGTLDIDDIDSFGDSAYGTTVAGGATLVVRPFPTPATTSEPLALSDGAILTTIGDVWFKGNVTLAGEALLTVASGTARFGGLMSGAGGFRIKGNGTALFSNEVETTGTTRVDGGNLVMNGIDELHTRWELLDGTFSGNRIAGYFNGSGGTFSPGDPMASPGVLKLNGLVGTTGLESVFQLQGPAAGTGYDQVQVVEPSIIAKVVPNTKGSAIALGGKLTVELSFNPADGQQFRIIDNQTTDAVWGSFDGLPEGATVPYDTVHNVASGGPATTLQISYTGGDGNDVVLTAHVAAPPEPAVPVPATGTVALAVMGIALAIGATVRRT